MITRAYVYLAGREAAQIPREDAERLLAARFDRLRADHPDYSFEPDPEILGPHAPVPAGAGGHSGWVWLATATTRETDT